MSGPASWSTALARAVAAALVVAFGFGVRDGVRTLRHNTYVHLSRYFWSYAAVPIVALAALSLLPASAAGVVGYALHGSPKWIAGASAGVCVGVCLMVDACGWFAGLSVALSSTQAPLAVQRRAQVCAIVPLLAAIGLAITLATFVAAQLGTTGLYRVGWAIAVLDTVLLIPALSFVVRDFHSLLGGAGARRLQRSRAPWIWAAPSPLFRVGDPRPAISHPRPSVILISIDTLRADRLGAYGSTRNLTSNLDQLAARGVVCETAIAASSWTLPSVASFLTGLTPSRHGAGGAVNGFDLLARAPLRRGTWTLAQALKAAGYRTHAMVSNPYLAVQYGLDAGFDTYENVSVESEALLALRPTVAGQLLGPALDHRLTDSGRLVTRRALHLLNALTRAPAHSHTPFFLWLHYIDPHAPYGCAGHKSFRGDTLLSGIAASADWRNGFHAIARLRAGEIRLTPEEKRQLIALYDAGVAAVDAQVGAIVNRVRESCTDFSAPSTGSPAHSRTGSPVSDPLIVIVSDHGEEFWEHGGVEHGHTFYDELVRVPLILAGAGLPEGERVHELVRLIDLPPTILELLSLPIPDALDGLSFTGSLAHRHTDSPADARTALCESLLFAEDKIALRTRNYKYIRWGNGKEELYDLRGDPAELRDVAGSVDLDWARRLVAEHAHVPPEPAEPFEWTAAETAMLHARLEALGYIG